MTAPLLGTLTVIGGLIGAGLGLWAVFDKPGVQRRFAEWSATDVTPVQHLIGAPGTIAFLAGVHQVVFDFDVWRNFVAGQDWMGAPSLSSWDTLLVLSVVQIAFFLAQGFVGRR